jgi:methionyl-tRNA formyltransferase
MRIIIITQNDPFFLAKNLDYLFKITPDYINIVGCIVNDASPFGKKESFYRKIKKTFNVFGFSFFCFYSFRFLIRKIFFFNTINNVLKKNRTPKIILKEDINHPHSLELLRSYKPDLLVSILGNEIFKKELIDLAPKGCINLHTALLPKYRGLMPSFWVMKNDEKYTGVSVFFVDEGIDSGPIIIQEKIEIGNKTQQELITDTKKLGMDLIVKAFNLIHQNNLNLISNDDHNMTYYSFPKKEDVQEFKKKGKKFF